MVSPLEGTLAVLILVDLDCPCHDAHSQNYLVEDKECD